MAGPWEQYGREEAVPPAPVPSAPVSTPWSGYSREPEPPAGGIDWSQLNKPTGEAKTATYAPSERMVNATQDALISAGMEPNRARHLAEGATSIARLNPLVNAAVSGADVQYDVKSPGRGWVQSAIDAAGLLPAGNVAQRAVQGYPRMRMADIPSSGELFTSGDQAFNRIARNATLYHPQAMGDYIARTARELGTVGPHGTPHTYANSPEYYDTLGRWYNSHYSGNTNPITPGDFMSLRSELLGLTKTPGGSSAAGRKAADRLEQYMVNPTGGFYAGTPSDLGALRRDMFMGQGDWRAARTAQTVERELANRTAAAQSAGNDVGDAARQTLSYFANTKAGARSIWGATPDERTMLRGASIPPATTDAARYIGQTLSSPWAAAIGSSTAGTAAHLFGLGPAATVGATTLGLGVPKVLSMPFKAAAREQATKAAKDAIENIQMNSPLFQAREAPPNISGTTMPVQYGGYIPPRGQPPVIDPRAQLRDAISYAMMPQLQGAATEGWQQFNVPYENTPEGRQ